MHDYCLKIKQRAYTRKDIKYIKDIMYTYIYISISVIFIFYNEKLINFPQMRESLFRHLRFLIRQHF